MRMYNGVLGVWGLVLLPVLACSNAAEVVRSTTYPPDFAYIARADVRTEMHALASKVAELDRVLREPGVKPRQQVSTLLIDIERIALSLQRGRGQSNHPLIDAHLPSLIEDVAASRRAVEAEPPNYFLAGSVVGSCVYCHR